MIQFTWKKIAFISPESELTDRISQSFQEMTEEHYDISIAFTNNEKRTLLFWMNIYPYELVYIYKELFLEYHSMDANFWKEYRCRVDLFLISE